MKVDFSDIIVNEFEHQFPKSKMVNAYQDFKLWCILTYGEQVYHRVIAELMAKLGNPEKDVVDEI